MFCVGGDGTMLPCMVIFKSPSGVLYQTWCEKGPEGTTYGATQSGWMDMNTFNQWFSVVFLNHVKTLPKEEVKVLIGDNLASHLSPYVIRLCQQWNIRWVIEHFSLSTGSSELRVPC